MPELTRQQALAIVRALPKATREAIALVVETAAVQGDYRQTDDGGSAWEESLDATLSDLAREIRGPDAPTA